MKKVCIITATRSEYGLLRWLIEEVKNDDQLILQLVVTGSHLSPEYGLTYTEIENDGYHIDEKVEMIISSSAMTGIVKAMGVCSIGFADVFNRLNPDIIIVLGDRYELLPICSAALIMNIPIAHISGGDITEGAIDNQIRNAITMLALIHFPGTEESAKRVERMIGCKEKIYCVGEPGLDNFYQLTLMGREDLARDFLLNPAKRWALMTYHPETRIGLEENLLAVKNIIHVLRKVEDIEVIITGSNSDYGGIQINEFLKNVSTDNKSKFKFFISLGQLRYSSIMNEVDFLIGNSSSGIVEAPFLAKPVINIGKRQMGRYMSENIISCSSQINSIEDALNKIESMNLNSNTYFGDGHTSPRIINILRNFFY